jgi:2,3-bisphosphoglycerate-independent phosphoglycerate mutase
MARILFFIIDGFADKPQKFTPLRLAKKEFLEKLLKEKSLSLYRFLPLEKNYWPKLGQRSVTGLANLGILGYKIKPEKFKRGPFEALGSDIDYKEGKLALRVDFASVNENLIVLDRRAGRNTYGLDRLTNEINNFKFEVPFKFYHTYGHRGVLIFEKNLSEKISDSDPYERNRKVKKIKPLSKDKKSVYTAKILWKFLLLTHEILNKSSVNKERIKKGLLPANFLLTREAGNKFPKLKNFFKINKIKNGLVIAENGALKGGCKLVGFDSLTLPEIENLEERYKFYFEKILENLKNYDLLYIHIKEADEASHDKNFQKKKEFFEFFDNWFEKLFLEIKKEEDPLFVITGDHITDTKTGKHLWGPLPLILIKSKEAKNEPKEISELESLKFPLIKPKKLWRMLTK